jgi:hypothetical protein
VSLSPLGEVLASLSPLGEILGILSRLGETLTSSSHFVSYHPVYLARRGTGECISSPPHSDLYIIYILFIYHLYITHPDSGITWVDDRVRPRIPPAITRLSCLPWHSAGLLTCLPPINTSWEDAHSWGIPFLGHTLFWMTARGSRHLYFVHIFYLSYIIMILLARSKIVRINICKMKYLQNTRPCRKSRTVDPAKRDLKQTNIELAMLDFHLG